MKFFLTIGFVLLSILFLSGCATWDGVKQDTSKAYNATKEAIHEATE
jgi:predicted small secreted protein